MSCCLPFSCPHCEHVYSKFSHNDSFLTSFYEIFFTDPCPSCGIKIQKTGGCSTVQCCKCQFKFCWYCKKQGESQHNKKTCIAHQSVKWLIYLHITVTIFLSFNVHSFISHLVKSFLFSIGNVFFTSFVVKLCFYNILCILTGMTIFGLTKTTQIVVKIIKQNQNGTYIEKLYKKRRHHIILTFITSSIAMSAITIVHYNNCFYDMLGFIFCETLSILTFILAYLSLSLLSHTVHSSSTTSL